MSATQAAPFDPAVYKATTREQWQHAAEPWHRWGPTLEEWLESGQDLQDLPMRPDGKRLRDLAPGEAKERVLHYLDKSRQAAAAQNLYARPAAGKALSTRELQIASAAIGARKRRKMSS